MITMPYMIRKIKKEKGYNLNIIVPILNAFIRQISQSMIDGDKVYIKDWGVFRPVQHKAKKARNPRTNLEIMVPARKRIRFTMCKKLGQLLNKEGK